MYLGQDSGLNLVMVIEILEVLLLVDSVALGIEAKRKAVRIVNWVLAAFWLACIIANAIIYLI